MSLKYGRLFIVISLVTLSFCLVFQNYSHCDDLSDHGLLVSLAPYGGVSPEKALMISNVERLLSIPLTPTAAKDMIITPNFPRFPFNRNYIKTLKTSKSARDEFFESDWFMPGRELVRSQESWVRLASLDSRIGISKSTAAKMMGPIEEVSSVGALAARPGDMFQGFEIRVKRSDYLVQLYAIYEPGKEKLLEEFKAGLGSPEYPTPRGRYLILRIFDKNPLWIPPRNREWAYGQSPSRNVYGGHMMPFFSKLPVKGYKRRAPVPDQGVDLIEPPMRTLDAGAYRIHGTNSPWSVGSNQSHGCVRMRNPEVERLANTIKLYAGTTTRGETPNGEYIGLERPVRLWLY